MKSDYFILNETEHMQAQLEAMDSMMAQQRTEAIEEFLLAHHADQQRHVLLEHEDRLNNSTTYILADRDAYDPDWQQDVQTLKTRWPFITLTLK